MPNEENDNFLGLDASGSVEGSFGDAQVTNRTRDFNPINPNSIRPDGIPLLGGKDQDLTYPSEVNSTNFNKSPDSIFQYVRFQAFQRTSNNFRLSVDANRALQTLNVTDVDINLTDTNNQNLAIEDQQGNGNIQATYPGVDTPAAGQLIPQGGDRRSGRVTTDKPSDIVKLYIPNELSFTDNVEYVTESTGDVGRILEGILGGDSKSRMKDAVQLGLLKKLDSLASNFVDGLDQSIRARFGFAQNPREEGLFKNTTLKNFDMKFTFSPRNKTEVEIVYNIIEVFRFHMMPELSKSSFVLFSPAEFEIDFLYADYSDPVKIEFLENTSLPKLGRCFLKSVTVDYSPNVKSAFLKDGTAAEISLNLTFMQAAHLNRQMIARGF